MEVPAMSTNTSHFEHDIKGPQGSTERVADPTRPPAGDRVAFADPEIDTGCTTSLGERSNKLCDALGCAILHQLRQIDGLTAASGEWIVMKRQSREGTRTTSMTELLNILWDLFVPKAFAAHGGTLDATLQGGHSSRKSGNVAPELVQIVRIFIVGWLDASREKINLVSDLETSDAIPANRGVNSLGILNGPVGGVRTHV
mmetsp:Transcript_25300/g.58286  ORF Transcript_25300/g.58286 Transcript_25300/m.58286 type:complete len:200 (+) Transcript_25300:436-1035(+)